MNIFQKSFIKPYKIFFKKYFLDEYFLEDIFRRIYQKIFITGLKEALKACVTGRGHFFKNVLRINFLDGYICGINIFKFIFSYLKEMSGKI